MSNKIIHIADFYYPEVLGGGELNNHELVQLLKQEGITVECKKSEEVSLDYLRNNNQVFYIISNFMALGLEQKEYITENCNYIIYEHDHKYLLNRNPAAFEDYKAPKSQLTNVLFYQNAKKIIVQSKLHESIINKNLSSINTVSVSGNLWSLSSLSLLQKLSSNKKRKFYSILDSPIMHKNTRASVNYCEIKKIPYELIKSSKYEKFLKKLSRNEKLLFLPKTPETLSRVVVEAKMLGVKVITNKNVGAAHENWFSLSGPELIKTMTDKRKQITKIILEVLNG